MPTIIPSVDTFYEGTEKTLQLFVPLSGPGLLKITDGEWDRILTSVGAKIISKVSNQISNSYVLSESSLFVWKNRILLKTCGTTTLLSAIQPIRAMLKQNFNGIKISSLLYSHKDFLKPEKQEYPYTSIESEKDYMHTYFSNGKWYHFDHQGEPKTKWLVFVFVNKKMLDFDNPRIELTMNGLDSTCLDKFSKCSYNHPDQEMKKACEMDKLFSGSALDDIAFDPYGYSINGLKDHNYFTIHVTPQKGCSYASFETNHDSLISLDACLKIIKLFKPTQFCLSVICRPQQKRKIDNLLKAFANRHILKENKIGTRIPKVTSQIFFSCYCATERNNEWIRLLTLLME